MVYFIPELEILMHAFCISLAGLNVLYVIIAK